MLLLSSHACTQGGHKLPSKSSLLDTDVVPTDAPLRTVRISHLARALTGLAPDP